MGKSLERLIAEGVTKVKDTPGNISMPEPLGDPGKGGNDPKAKGTPAPPSKLLTDPKEKLKDIDKVTKRTKSAEPQAAKKNGDQSPVLQGNSKIKEGHSPEEEEDDIELEDSEDLFDDEEDDDSEDVIEIPEEISELVDGLSEDELKVKYAELLALLAEAEEDNEDELANAESIEEESSETIADIRKKITSDDIDLTEDISALFSDDEELSEEFQKKAVIIFESAVVAKVNQKLDEMEEAFKTYMAEAIEENEKNLTEKVDSYLNYVVESWLEENQIAIERGLRSEIAEDFMQGLHQLFVEKYISVPDEKIDVMESLAENIDELKSRLNEEIEKNIDLQNGYKELIRDSIVVSESKGLSEAQAEKLKGLAEGVDFESIEDLKKALNVIKESYFNKKNSNDSDDLDDVDSDLEVSLTEEINESDVMSKYGRALSRFNGNRK